MSGSGVAVLDIRKVVPQNSQVARSFFRDAAERVPPQLGQVSAFMLRLYDKVGQILAPPNLPPYKIGKRLNAKAQGRKEKALKTLATWRLCVKGLKISRNVGA